MSQIDLGKIVIIPKGDWVSTNNYERLDLVTVKDNNGVNNVYLSLKDVPANTLITDTNYWVFLFKGYSNDSLTSGSIILPAGPTSTRPDPTTVIGIRFNTTTEIWESSDGNIWQDIGSGGGGFSYSETDPLLNPLLINKVKPGYVWMIPSTGVTYRRILDTDGVTTFWLDITPDKNIGTPSTLSRYLFITTFGQTLISGTDINGNTLSLVPGTEVVIVNGAVFNYNVDYTFDVNNNIVLNNFRKDNDEIVVLVFENFTIANTYTKAQVDSLIPKNIPLPSEGLKNFLINGNFDVWSYADVQTISGYASDDCWLNQNLGSNKTHSKMVCGDTERALFNANFYSRTVVNSVPGANNFVIKTGRIEDVTRLAGLPVTLSFWARSDATRNIGIMLDQYFGIGGNASSINTNINPLIVSLTTDWNFFTYSFVIPSIVGKVIGTSGVKNTWTSINFGFDIGSGLTPMWNGLNNQQSGTFDLAQVQLQKGIVPANMVMFENRPFTLEEMLCMRYHQKGTINGSFYQLGGNGGYITKELPVRMRLTPTIAYTNTTVINASNAVLNVTDTQIYSSAYCTATGSLSHNANYELFAELQ